LHLLNTDPAQARAYIKQQPGFSGLSDELLDQQIDTFRKMDPEMLKKALAMVKPLVGYYQTVDAKTGGRGKYVLFLTFLVLVVIGCYLTYLCWGLFWTVWGYVFGFSSGPGSTGAEAYVSSGGVGDSGGGVSEVGSGAESNAGGTGGMFSGHTGDDGGDEFEF
jgi:hypothetical protein